MSTLPRLDLNKLHEEFKSQVTELHLAEDKEIDSLGDYCNMDICDCTFIYNYSSTIGSYVDWVDNALSKENYIKGETTYLINIFSNIHPEDHIIFIFQGQSNLSLVMSIASGFFADAARKYLIER